jgi:hypothetical protein
MMITFLRIISHSLFKKIKKIISNFPNFAFPHISKKVCRFSAFMLFFLQSVVVGRVEEFEPRVRLARSQPFIPLEVGHTISFAALVEFCALPSLLAISNELAR